MFPFSSTAINLSASPSYARPKLALCLTTSSCNFSGCVDPHLSIILFPSGSLFIVTTFAPNSINIVGATVYDAPLAQSSTTFNPLKSTFTIDFK